MAVNYIKGAALLQIDGDRVLCANSVGLNSNYDETTVNCEATGDTNITTPGNHNWSISQDGVWRVLTEDDATGQITYDDLMGLHLAKTILPVEFSPEENGLYKYTGSVFIQELNLTSQTGEVAAYSMTLKPTTALTRTLID